ncbi:MAG: LTA synthase family protein [bacterium]|nr:LTA synthase family protein [bacterium]
MLLPRRPPGSLSTLLVTLLVSSVLACSGSQSRDRPRPTSQPTTTYSFSILEGSLPRLLFVGRERNADLILRNDGFNDWEGERTFFFSPRWLGLWGDQVVEEGFRTPLKERVAPGAETLVAVRIKPPRSFGLYRVKWDLQSEQSGWFAQFDRTPEAPRWVLVLPPVELFLAVLLPCLVLGTAILIHRPASSRTAGVAVAYLGLLDLIWCATSLLGKPYVLYVELAPKFWPGPKLVTFSVVAFLLLPLCFLPARLRSVAAWLLAALGALVVWAQVIYFRFFLDLASSVAALAGRQATDLGATIDFLAKPTDLWLAFDLLLALPVLWLLSKSRRDATGGRRRGVNLVLAVLAIPFFLSAAKALTTGQLQGRRNLQNLRAVSTYGLYGFQLLDAGTRIVGRWRQPAVTPEELDRVFAWFEETRPQREIGGATAGLAEGLNLIAIQVESMQEFVVDLDVEGVAVMPNLRRLRESALEFSMVLDQTSRGRSSAGDFVALASMLPVGESIAYEYPKNDYYSIAHALSDRGYTTISAIPYKGSFWNRQATHPAYGFETNLFRSGFERRGPKVGWGINDRDFLEQMVPVLDALDEPFFAWLTTLSVHYPYESFPSELKSRSMGDLEGTRLGNYLHGMSLFDRALEELAARLEDNGLLDRTVIAIWGDHASGLNRDQDFVDYFGLERPAKKFLFGRVPFMIWLPPDRSLRRLETAPAGQVDIAPTLLALMGVDPGDLALMGRNLLQESIRGRVVHPQGRWVDSEHLYLSQFADRAGACWTSTTRRAVPIPRCEAGSEDAERQLEVVFLVLQHNLQAEMSRRLASSD